MLEPVTYSVSELAQRWNVTPRQILDMALQLRVPLYFNFDGLAFDAADRWHRHAGDYLETEKLKALQASIERNNAWLARRARGELGEYDYLSDEDARKLRKTISEDEHKVIALRDKLEEREIGRRHAQYRGIVRTPPLSLLEIMENGETATPRWAYRVGSPIKVVHIPARKYGGAAGPVWEGHLLALEPYLTPWRKLTADSLFAMTAEVKAIEAHQQSKNSPAPEPDLPADAAPSGIDYSMLATPERLIEAFGSFTGMNEGWFRNTKDRPDLHEAKAIAGVRGRNGQPPLFNVFGVMQYLISPSRRQGERLSERTAWRLLKSNFPKVYAAHESLAPDDSD